MKLMTALIIASFAARVMASDVEFAEEDFAAYGVDGTATVDGEAFARTRGGQVKTCAGEKVLLAPDTAFDVEVITAFRFVNTENALKHAGPAAMYWKESICDSQGKFTFEDLPAGKWIVITSVKFEVADPAMAFSGTSRQGGLMAKRVATGEKKAKVIITDVNGRWNYLLQSTWLSKG